MSDYVPEQQRGYPQERLAPPSDASQEWPRGRHRAPHSYDESSGRNDSYGRDHSYGQDYGQQYPPQQYSGQHRGQQQYGQPGYPQQAYPEHEVPQPQPQHYPRGVPPQRPRRTGLMVGILGAVAAVVVIAVVAFVLAGNSGSSTPVASRSASTPANPAPTPTPPSPAPAPSAQVVSQVNQWYSSFGAPALQKLGTDLKNFGGASGNLQAEKAACERLQTDVQADKAGPPVPADRVIAADWNNSLNSLSSAAVNCEAGIDDANSSQLSKAGAELTQGGADVTKMVDDTNDLRASAG